MTLMRLSESSDQFGADGVQDAGRHAQAVTCRRGRRAGPSPCRGTDPRTHRNRNLGARRQALRVLFLGESGGLRRCSGEPLFFNDLRFARNYRLCAISKLRVVGIDSTDARNTGHGNLVLSGSSVRSARDTRAKLAFKPPARPSSAALFRWVSMMQSGLRASLPVFNLMSEAFCLTQGSLLAGVWGVRRGI